MIVRLAVNSMAQAGGKHVAGERQADIGRPRPENCEILGRGAHHDEAGLFSLFTGAHALHRRLVCRSAGLGAKPWAGR